MVSTTRVLLVFVYIVAILLVISLLPREIHFFGNQVLRIPQLSDVFSSRDTPPRYADISQLQKDFEKNNITEKVEKKEVKIEFRTFKPDTLRLRPHLRIQYADMPQADTALYPFFRALQNLEKSKEHIRVLHYGDSQLEGDRITAFLREKFQAEFGGSGVGMVDIVDNLHTKTCISQKASANWIQSAIFGKNTYRLGKSNYFGVMGHVYKFYIPPAQPAGKRTKIQSMVYYAKNPHATPRQQKVENVKIMFRNPEAPFELQIESQSDSSIRQEIPVNKDFQIYEYPIRGEFENIRITFSSNVASPEVLGVSLDANFGITFDNIPLRGSSGVEFTRINREYFKQQIEKLNVKCMILQFGVNIVPYILNDYTFYEDQLVEQLNFLKSLNEQMSILVIGVSDMSRRSISGFETYPNVEKIRNAQKKAAFRTGCAFWDLYEAMGGRNSMPSWVMANPPLATKDFIHFTERGAQLVAEMLYQALITEYSEFYKRNIP
ncbi:MAG: hypothetical protein NZ551_02375 [Microscillaceae bacterium]|nr:hypothetical protein [Microscillaceae bacterium]MDW8460031.1 hypothetical protein [Cytophagales bacterium]